MQDAHATLRNHSGIQNGDYAVRCFEGHLLLKCMQFLKRGPQAWYLGSQQQFDTLQLLACNTRANNGANMTILCIMPSTIEAARSYSSGVSTRSTVPHKDLHQQLPDVLAKRPVLSVSFSKRCDIELSPERFTSSEAPSKFELHS
jgi:hypothetical protein